MIHWVETSYRHKTQTNLNLLVSTVSIYKKIKCLAKDLRTPNDILLNITVHYKFKRGFKNKRFLFHANKVVDLVLPCQKIDWNIFYTGLDLILLIRFNGWKKPQRICCRVNLRFSYTNCQLACINCPFYLPASS